MPHHFRPYQPEQPLLLPPDLRDWLPEDHLVYTVSELVDALDLAAFYAPYTQQGSGNLPYAPAMMVKILVYGYATGVLSSRRLAQKLEEDVAFRVLAAGNRPQHRTLCEFRRRHRADFGAVLVAVVQLARDLGLVSLTTWVPYSTKVRANASKCKAMSYGRMQQEEARLSAEIEALQAAAEALDTAEDAQFGMDLRGDEMPVALQQRESRRGVHRRNHPGGASGRPRRDTRAPEPIQLHGPREPHHAHQPGRLPAMLQRAAGGGCRQSADCHRGGLSPGQRPGSVTAAAGCRRGALRPHP